MKGSRRFNGLIPGLSAAALVVAAPAAQAQGQPDSGLLYATPGADITDLVMERLDSLSDEDLESSPDEG